MEKYNEHFWAALKYCIDELPRGTKAKLARTVNIAPPYLGDILKKRSKGSEATRRKIALALGYEYEDFLALGEKLLRSNNDVKLKAVKPQAEFDLYASERAKSLIKKIVVISKYEEEKLSFVEVTVNLIYDDIKQKHNLKEEKQSA